MSARALELPVGATDRAPAARRLRRFVDALIAVELLVVIPSAILLLVLVGEPSAAVPLVVVSLFTIGVIVARRHLVRGDVRTAVVIVTAVFLPAAVMAAFAGDYALPMLAIATVLPPTLAVPFLSSRSTLGLMIASVSSAAFLTLISVNSSGFGFESELPQWYETANVIVGAPIACALVLLLARQNHLTLLEQDDDLRASQRRIVTTADAERRRAERDLHDGAQQRLHSAIVQVALARRLLATDRVAADGVLARTTDEIRGSGEELTRLAHGFLPTALVHGGLGGALAELARRSSIPVRVLAVPLVRLPLDVESTVWFCCNEAVQNVHKHAGPHATATIDVESTDGVVRFEVADDGNGASGSGDRGQGIANMQARVAGHGGDLALRAVAGSGTTVTGTVPLSGASTHAGRTQGGA